MSNTPWDQPPRIRSSFDLELRLSFDKSPLTRPSNNLHKEAQDWFEEAKQRTIERQKVAENAKKYPPPSFSDNHPINITYPEAAKSPHNSPDFLQQKRPMGPRPDIGYAMKDPVGFGNNNLGYKSSTPIYKQPRYYLSLITLLLSLSTLSIYILLLKSPTQPPPTSITLSTPYLPLASVLSTLLSILSIAMYLIYPLGYGTPFRVFDGIFSSVLEVIVHLGAVVLWGFALYKAVALGECAVDAGNTCLVATMVVVLGGVAGFLMVGGALVRGWEVVGSGMFRRALERR
ncbi:hypothetical protein HK097_002153 [Rhizophlyctis rosea]|uniref:Uncharacterized protein n=1 Tax=Rhizophlyctis rosea TaxID=64517 RepID=A0AAD5S5R2_9FUNG|nr:hypothetical protein HK097_002153 [Rhizophlyctis rosea]